MTLRTASDARAEDQGAGHRWRRGRRVAAVAAAIAAATMLPPAPPGAANRVAPAAPAAPEDVKKEFAKLQKRANALNKEYRGQLLSLDEAKGAAQRATNDSGRLTRQWAGARGSVATLAADSYKSGATQTIPIFTSDDVGTALKDAATVEHIARNNSFRMRNLQILADRATRSQQAAKAKMAEVRKQLDDLESQRARVKKLLAKFKPEAPSRPAGGGGPAGRPDGVSGAKSPITGNSMTARMRNVLLKIDGRFGPFPAIGCSRPGDPQDHGSGRACDFMESTGGRLPSASAKVHGDSVANYATSNASALGIKYVIWRQRIWDVRSGGGWRAMENRGSVTANHMDHVHVSVL